MTPQVTTTLIKIILPWVLKWTPRLFINSKIFKKMKKKGKDLLVESAVKLIKFFEEIQAGFADDGKLTWNEIIGLLPNITGFWTIIAGWGEIKTLWQSYAADPALRADLIATLKEELDIPNDNVEQVIEEAFDVLDQMFELSVAIKNLSNK